ncbi:MAG: hypothetical protein ACK41P_09600 [Asticcacaulis sp.]
MMSLTKKTALSALVLVVSATGLVACGKQGKLEQAPPLWGDKAKAEYEAERKKEADAKAADDKAPPRALPNAKQANTMPDPYQQNRTNRDAPIEGIGNDPTRGPARPQ